MANKAEIDNAEIKFLKAGYGDSILVSFLQGNQKRNILIDGGPAATYVGRDNRDGALKMALDKLSSNEKINLLVVTHVDNDHICGILKWLERDPLAYDKIEEVWFNSEGHIANFLNKKPVVEHQVWTNVAQGRRLGYNQGKSLEMYLNERNNITWKEQVIDDNGDLDLFEGAIHIRILSPNQSKLELLLKNWGTILEEPTPELAGKRKLAGKQNDYEISLKTHIQNDIVEKFKEDEAPHNGSSIAFILTINQKNLVFLADAHPTVIEQSLKKYGFSEKSPLEAELVKLSHHGSRYNNSKEMLKMIKSSNFVISTNGMGQVSHPHKRLIARLISIHPNCQIHFNYPSLINSIIKEDDRVDFPGLTALHVESFKI